MHVPQTKATTARENGESNRPAPNKAEYEKARRVAKSVTKDEDMADEALARASLKWDPSKGAFSTLVHGVAKNVLREDRRKKARASRTVEPKHVALPLSAERVKRGASLQFGEHLVRWLDRTALNLVAVLWGGRTQEERAQGPERTAEWLRVCALPTLQGHKINVQPAPDFDAKLAKYIRRAAATTMTSHGRHWVESDKTTPPRRPGAARKPPHRVTRAESVGTGPSSCGVEIQVDAFWQDARRQMLRGIARKALALCGVPGTRLNHVTSELRNREREEHRRAVEIYVRGKSGRQN